MSSYQDFYHESHELQNHFMDIVDNHNHPQAKVLQHHLHQLAEDFEMQKDRQHMDDRLKGLDHEIEQAKYQPTAFVNQQDLSDLQHRVRQMRDRVRHAPDLR